MVHPNVRSIWTCLENHPLLIWSDLCVVVYRQILSFELLLLPFRKDVPALVWLGLFEPKFLFCFAKCFGQLDFTGQSAVNVRVLP